MFPQSGASKIIYRFYDVHRFVQELTRIRACFALIRSKVRRFSLQVQTLLGKGRLEIQWPRPSGKVERITELPIDRYVTIIEGAGKWK
jgi:hypothetical protein